MFSPINYPFFNQFSLISCYVRPTCENACPVVSYLAFGKLPENIVVTPNTTTQVIRPSSVNKFLQTVTVKPAA